MYFLVIYFLRLFQKVTLKIVVITAFFLVCVAPFCITFVVTSLSENIQAMANAYYATYALALLNSALQPLLICSICRPVRLEVVRLLSSCRGVVTRQPRVEGSQGTSATLSSNLRTTE